MLQFYEHFWRKFYFHAIVVSNDISLITVCNSFWICWRECCVIICMFDAIIYAKGTAWLLKLAQCCSFTNIFGGNFPSMQYRCQQCYFIAAINLYGYLAQFEQNIFICLILWINIHITDKKTEISSKWIFSLIKFPHFICTNCRVRGSAVTECSSKRLTEGGNDTVIR